MARIEQYDQLYGLIATLCAADDPPVELLEAFNLLASLHRPARWVRPKARSGELYAAAATAIDVLLATSDTLREHLDLRAVADLLALARPPQMTAVGDHR